MRFKIMCFAIVSCALIINSTQGKETKAEIEKVTETVKDVDGNVYTTVQIGNQIWTVENWRSTKYNDGSAIPNVTDGAQWKNLTTGAYCYYDNSAANKTKYGALYNWYAVNTGKIAPKGWRVPTDADWTKLEKYLIANGYNWEGSRRKNKIAKSLASRTDWEIDTDAGTPGNNLESNNKSGFSALPGGYRWGDSWGGRWGEEGSGYWWSATESGGGAWNRSLYYGYEYLYRNGYGKSCGFSLRLVRD